MIISILLACIVAATLVSILMVVSSARKKREKGGTSNKVQKKGRSAVIKEAEKKLAKDPHNVASLETLGELYYGDKDWEHVWNVYKTLYDISSAHVEINVAKVTGRMGIAAYQMERYDDAVNALMLSLKKDPENFEANYFLGKTFYNKAIYDKAVYCFKKAKAINPENTELNELMGLALFKAAKYREALPFLKRTLDEHPDHKEVLYDMAVSMAECGMGDKALKVFVHLRPDPTFGSQACLEAGKLHERVKDFQNAVQDYEIAMKLSNVPEQTMMQIKYRCACTYIAMNEIAKGLALLKQIQEVKSGYKDVDALVVRYAELNQNKNLQTYLMSGTSDFVALCRKVISAYHTGCFVKVEDVQVASESVDIICTVESSKWDAKEIFRFYRNQTVIGDIYVREFHSKLRDSKCDKGVCAVMGSFSESSHKYIEGRPVDLVEKEQLGKILKKINILN